MEKSKETINLIHEYNDHGCLIYLQDYPGAFVRGKTKEEALKKISPELMRYNDWQGNSFFSFSELDCQIVESLKSYAQIEDGDTNVIFAVEKRPLELNEYLFLKALVLKSASDFLELYASIPDVNLALKESRTTFYGKVPITAAAMYEHIKNVNFYYFGEINIPLQLNLDLLQGREEGFEKLENNPNFLGNELYQSGDEELWTLRKTLRRFIWHDAIHAKALYRGAIRVFPQSKIFNPFCFPF